MVYGAHYVIEDITSANVRDFKLQHGFVEMTISTPNIVATERFASF